MQDFYAAISAHQGGGVDSSEVKTMTFVFETRKFVSKTRNLAFQMIDFAGQGGVQVSEGR